MDATKAILRFAQTVKRANIQPTLTADAIMKTVLIAAMAKKNRVIWNSGKLPWHLPEDLANFKKLTSWSPVVMGRKTYESLPEKFRPLPNRKNVVISREGYSWEGFVSVRSPEEALEALRREWEERAFVIWGSQIYSAFLDSGLADELWISLVPWEFSWDALFPEFENGYCEIERAAFETFTFVKYGKR